MNQGTAVTPPRPSGFLEGARDRLEADATMRVRLGGQDRVGLSYEGDLPGGNQAAEWHRLVIVPVTRGYPIADQPGRMLVLPFQVRSDVHLPEEDGGATPIYAHELIQLRAFELLEGWLPTGIPDVEIRNRVWRTDAPDPIPLWDESRDFSFTVATYRVVLLSPDT